MNVSPVASHPARRSNGRGEATEASSGARAPGGRERIVRATQRLIAEEGLGALTNRRVAAIAGVSLGSLTYHFPSQSDLLRESLLLYVREETERREAIAEELARQDLTLERVAQAVEDVVAVATDVPEQLAELELHLHAARDPELREASRRCFEAHEKVARAALGALGVAEAERHAAKVVALMVGLAVRRLAEGGGDAQGTSEALVALVRGLEDAPRNSGAAARSPKRQASRPARAPR